MAITDQELKQYKAFKVGYVLSEEEPRLLESIIKSNPKNEFVAMMRTGRDLQQFHVGIPRKDHDVEFKNGYYNGRALAEYRPEALKRVLESKGLSKKYVQGVSTALQEYQVKSIRERMNQGLQKPTNEMRKDVSFNRGFNIGYRLPMATKYALTENTKYTKLLRGIKAGVEKHKADLTELRAKNPKATLFKESRAEAKLMNQHLDKNVMSLVQISGRQTKLLNQAPDWMQQKLPLNKPAAPQKLKAKGKDLDDR